MVVESKLYRHFVAAAPGLKELMTIGKIWYEAERTDERSKVPYKCVQGRDNTVDVEVLGKKYPCKWHKSSGTTDAGPLTTTTWVSVDMPGEIVKSVSLVPAVEETTTIEVTAVTIPS